MSNVFTVKSCKGELVNQSICDYFASKHLLDNITHNCIFHIKDLQFEHTGKYDLPNFVNLLVGILNTYRLATDKNATFSNINDVLDKLTIYIEDLISTSGFKEFITFNHHLKLIDKEDSISIEASLSFYNANSFLFDLFNETNQTYLYDIRITNKKE